MTDDSSQLAESSSLRAEGRRDEWPRGALFSLHWEEEGPSLLLFFDTFYKIRVRTRL